MSTPFDNRTWMRPSSCVTPFDETAIQLEIEINNDSNVTITQSNPYSMPTNIWLGACNIYYDREFYAIRGDINCGPEEGESSRFIGPHFIIFYVGKMGINGKSRQILIEFYDKKDIYTPTLVLIHRFIKRRPKVIMSYRGSWKADN